MLELEGTKIILREFSEVNLYDKKYYSWLRDLDVVGLINRLEYILPIQFKEIESYVNSVWENPNDAFFAIYTKDENEFIGTQRISEIDWRTGIANIGIMIGEKQYWGKGIAKDSVSVACAYSFDKLSLRKLTAGTPENNVGMIKCFETLGFKLEGIRRKQVFINNKHLDRHLFGLFKDEFKPFRIAGD